MKKIIASAFVLSLFVVSCKKESKTEPSVNATDSLSGTVSQDSTVVPSDSTRNTSSAVVTENIITRNADKYPNEINLFEDKNIGERLKNLAGTEYNEMIKNFNVQSPITSENGIFKTTGCKQHNCPAYFTSIYYDAKNDNLNISIDKNGKVTEFSEKGKITISESLKTK